MYDYIIIDGHCDTLTKVMDKGFKINNSETNQHVTIQGLINGNVRLQFFAAWVGNKKIYGPFLQRGLRLIDVYWSMVKEFSDIFYPIKEFKDIKSAIDLGKIGTILTVEGGEILEGEIANLRILYHLGVRAMTLTWNQRNEIADGIMEKRSQGGLSQFGLDVVHEMNDLNMLIDISHLSETGFWDVMEVSSKPVVATHSNAKRICPHPRNLDDDQLKYIAKKEGLVGINFNPPFLSTNEAGIDDIFAHIEYIAGLIGIDHIGFGSDFDGIDGLPKGITGPQGFPYIIERLFKANYKEDDVLKICSGNYQRVLEKTL